ncbi:hypothetical protein GCM10023204_10150 [Actinomycetospora succinea]
MGKPQVTDGAGEAAGVSASAVRDGSAVVTAVLPRPWSSPASRTHTTSVPPLVSPGITAV